MGDLDSDMTVFYNDNKFQNMNIWGVILLEIYILVPFFLSEGRLDWEYGHFSIYNTQYFINCYDVTSCQ